MSLFFGAGGVGGEDEGVGCREEGQRRSEEGEALHRTERALLKHAPRRDGQRVDGLGVEAGEEGGVEVAEAEQEGVVRAGAEERHARAAREGDRPAHPQGHVLQRGVIGGGRAGFLVGVQRPRWPPRRHGIAEPERHAHVGRGEQGLGRAVQPVDVRQGQAEGALGDDAGGDGGRHEEQQELEAEVPGQRRSQGRRRRGTRAWFLRPERRQ